MAGIWGKLRGHGDFLALGLDEAARAAVVPWLDAGLAALREEWGEAWGPRFDGMGMLGFWIGPLAGGGAPLAGVMAPSRDKVGRRYPLLILGRGEVAPPMLVPGRFHAAAGAALAALLEAGRAEAGAWPQALGEAAPATPPEDPSLVWARNPGCSGGELLAEILRYDHAAACAGRVQFWTLAAPGVVLTCDGLPTARALGWLIEASQSEAARAAAGPVDGHSEIVAEPAPEPAAAPLVAAPLVAALPALMPETVLSTAGMVADLSEPPAGAASPVSPGGPGVPPAGETNDPIAAAGPDAASGTEGWREDGASIAPGIPAAGPGETADAAQDAAASDPAGLEAVAGPGGPAGAPGPDAAPAPEGGPEAVAAGQGVADAGSGHPAGVPRPDAASGPVRQPAAESAAPGAASGPTDAPAARSAPGEPEAAPALPAETAPAAQDAPGQPGTEAASAPPGETAPAALRLEPRFRLGAEEQVDSRLVLRSEWALPEGAGRPREPVDAAIWQLPEAPAESETEPPREAE